MSSETSRFSRLVVFAWIALGVAAIVSLGVATSFGREANESNGQARIAQLESEIRCPTCEGQSVAQSEADMAKAAREEIRRRVANGESDESIRTYFLERYGNEAFVVPEKRGVGLIAWLLPVVITVIVASMTLMRLRRRRPLRSDAREVLVVKSRPTKWWELPIVHWLVVAACALAIVAVVAVIATRHDDGQLATIRQAETLENEGRVVDAMRTYDAILKRDPENAIALLGKGELLWRARLGSEALQSLDRAIEVAPTLANAYRVRAMVREELLHDNDRAKVDYEMFVRLAPNDPDISAVNERLGRLRTR